MNLHNRQVETSRLILRPFQENHTRPLYEIQRNQESMRYTYHTDSIEESRKRFLKYASLADTIGYAPWTVLQKSDQTIIGWGGLNIDPFDPGWGPEIAYFLHSKVWGRGYATELVKTSVDYGTKIIGLTEIGAFAHQENLASIRVLKKNGFSFVRYEPKIDRNYYSYTLK